jgi:hypothetical protein
MKKIQLILFVGLALHTATSLRLATEHLNYNNATDYLQGLLAQQSAFNAQINALSANVNNTVASANSANDIGSKINILENGILNQENGIFLTSATLIPVLVLNDQCQNLTDASRAVLIQQCQTTIQDIQILQARLQTLPQDARVL